MTPGVSLETEIANAAAEAWIGRVWWSCVGEKHQKHTGHKRYADTAIKTPTAGCGAVQLPYRQWAWAGHQALEPEEGESYSPGSRPSLNVYTAIVQPRGPESGQPQMFNGHGDTSKEGAEMLW